MIQNQQCNPLIQTGYKKSFKTVSFISFSSVFSATKQNINDHSPEYFSATVYRRRNAISTWTRRTQIQAPNEHKLKTWPRQHSATHTNKPREFESIFPRNTGKVGPAKENKKKTSKKAPQRKSRGRARRARKRKAILGGPVKELSRERRDLAREIE